MLGELARRLLWIPPTVVAVTLLAFALLSRTPSPGGAAGPFAHLPRFVNVAPADARTRALEAVERLRTEDSSAARATLTELGGAALPIVLPALDGLSPEPRARVASALSPLARRMGLVDTRSGDAGVPASVWVRFWDDRSLDFRPAAIRRAVRRYAEHPSPSRRREVETLDTAALEEIFDLLGRDGPLPPLDRALRLSQSVDHAIGREPIPDDASPDAVLAEVAGLRGFWLAHRLSYVTLDAPSRAAATVLETQYGKWAARAVAGNLGLSRDGRPVLAVVLRRGTETASLVSAGLVLGFLLGGALAAAAVLTGSRVLDRGALIALVLLAGAPPLLLGSMSSSPRGSALFAIAAVVALLASRRVRNALLDAAGSPHVVAAQARGSSLSRALFREVRNGLLPLFFTLSALELPVALSAAFVVEKLYGRSGLGAVAAEAVAGGDVSMLMALCVGGTLFTTVAVALGDFAQSLGDPRLYASKRRTGSG